MKNLLVVASLCLSVAAHAQVSFNSLTHAGTGCPQGTVSSVISPDGSSISILFDEFRAEVPQFDGNNDNGELPRGPGAPRGRNTPSLQHRSCSLSFTASLPPGVRAETLEVSLQARGATIFDQGVDGYFSSILVGFNGLARSRGNPTVVARRSFRTRRGPIDESWVETPRAVIPLGSGCSGAQGRDIRFDLKNHIQAEIASGDTGRRGLISVDSNDVNGLLRFTVRTVPCGGGRVAP